MYYVKGERGAVSNHVVMLVNNARNVEDNFNTFVQIAQQMC